MTVHREINDGYILKRTEAELERLRVPSRLWEPATARTLTLAGLAPGMACLDVGCGPGEVMRLMGRMVGPTGSVTGVDIDADLGADAAAELNAAGGSTFRFVDADINAGEPVSGAPFDFVFARFLLIHMTDPVATLRRLARLVRPGGRLVLMDYDLTRIAIRPDDQGIRRALDVVVQCFERSGKRPDTGVSLPELALAAGLTAPEGFAVEPFFGPFTIPGRMIRDVLVSLDDAIESYGIATRAEVSALSEHCRVVEEGGNHFASWPALHATWSTL